MTVEAWRDEETSSPDGGRPRIYRDAAIECALVVKRFFHLSLRAMARPGPFVYDSVRCDTAAPYVVEPGETCEVSLVFARREVGDHAAQLTGASTHRNGDGRWLLGRPSLLLRAAFPGVPELFRVGPGL